MSRWLRIDGLFYLLSAAMISISAAAWRAALLRRRSGQPIVPLAARRAAPWRAVDLAMIAAFYVLVSRAFWAVFSLFASAAEGGRFLPNPAEAATELAVGLAASIAANLMATGFALLWIFSHTDAAWPDLGWRRETVGGDVRLGLLTFAAIAAPIYGLQAVLSRFVEQQHPIVEALARQPAPLLYVLAGLSAVVVAPLAEEFFFRGLLQGWLESTGAAANLPAEETADRPPKRAAIFITSLIFALLHLGHGAAPIPLFFLSLALGYLYQRTHRLLPSVTVHFCLNACSFTILCLAPTPPAG